MIVRVQSINVLFCQRAVNARVKYSFLSSIFSETMLDNFQTVEHNFTLFQRVFGLSTWEFKAH